MKTPAEMTNRELDAAVASEVIGHQYVKWESRAGGRETVLVGNAFQVECAHYSTDPAAMMEVLGKMKERDPRGTITMMAVDEGWMVTNDYIHESDATVSTLPRAVAEAALLAVRSAKGTA